SRSATTALLTLRATSLALGSVLTTPTGTSIRASKAKLPWKSRTTPTSASAYTPALSLCCSLYTVSKTRWCHTTAGIKATPARPTSSATFCNLGNSYLAHCLGVHESGGNGVGAVVGFGHFV